ncbi:hypothetical protein OIU93_03870 [Paeniglutamicibacter sp. ZC-3]|uniref:hypothetical protein n=1 Tax=Paeniglutamicibacter sp. ZC-3 TaxID=2986919 RepID=UPI0021F6CC70|nr:hypothetical protein [Paeniglutamicibacter sp. ZC-3]MCV9993433.1 hypothetical protein [Paeniglutamicibacter sp. ZC-3]
MEDFEFTAEEAATILQISAKTLRQSLRTRRPLGARQVPPKPGGNWYLKAHYVEQLATARGITMPPRTTTPNRNQPIELDQKESMIRIPRDAPVGLIEHRIWSAWTSFHQALQAAPRFPGVYMFRSANHPQNGPIYIGAAGERSGNGLRGRLAIYASGKGAMSGLGEHAFDRAFADADWMRARLEETLAGRSRRTKELARLAIDHAELEIRWQTVPTKSEAVELEKTLIQQHRGNLWNR